MPLWCLLCAWKWPFIRLLALHTETCRASSKPRTSLAQSTGRELTTDLPVLRHTLERTHTCVVLYAIVHCALAVRGAAARGGSMCHAHARGTPGLR